MILDRKDTLCCVGLLILSQCAAQAATSVPLDPSLCTAERVQSLATAPLHIDSVAHIASRSEAGAHCVVGGYIDRGTRINFKIALPDAWNRKILFLGRGGFAGTLEPRGDLTVEYGASRGYATGTTDTGHVGSSGDASWALNNPVAIVNHYEVGVELAAAALKNIAAAYYAAVPVHSYFQGCSGGGRQGLVEAQRFPDTFDGIISAAPAWNYTKLFMDLMERSKLVLLNPENWIPPDTFAAIDRVVLKQCDKRDGVEDGIVMDPRMCRPALSELRCKSDSDNQACLTPQQLSVIDELTHPKYAGPATGYYGLYLTGSDREEVGRGWSYWMFGQQIPTAAAIEQPQGQTAPQRRPASELAAGFLSYIVKNDPQYDWRQFSIEKDAAAVEKAVGELVNADDTDLSRFVRRGGKLLVWHGWADPAIPPEMSIDLYNRIKQNTTGAFLREPIDESVRLFMVPGVQHCHYGSGLTDFDPLAALEKWVEQGQPPAKIIANQLVNGKPTRSRPVCRYPQAAHYRGTGDPDKAENFECR